MNRKRKKYLTIGSIIIIIASAFEMLMGLALFALGSFVDEDFMKEVYKSDECVYYEEADGSYYFVEIDEDGEEDITTQSDIIITVRVITTIIDFAGFVILGMGVAKLVLAIKVLSSSGKNKYAKGCTIALLTLTVLNTNIIEVIFLILAMCANDEQLIKSNQDNVCQPPDVIVK